MFQRAKMHYNLDLWRLKIWQTDTRYYRAEIKQDIFGQWVLECQWSGLNQKGGRHVVTPLTSIEAGLSALRAIEKKRNAHGYHEVLCD
jgi:hypothetical protein